MMGWPVWLRFLVINAGLPWAVVLSLRGLGLSGALALLAVLSAAVVVLTMNIWHLRRSRQWQWGFALVAVANPICTVFFSNLALATSLGPIWLLLRGLAATE
jgi:hypothetical protein